MKHMGSTNLGKSTHQSLWLSLRATPEVSLEVSIDIMKWVLGRLEVAVESS